MIKKLIKSSLMMATSRKYIIWNGKRNSKNIALTFDDGPDPVYTPEVLSILRSFKIKATFFLLGSKISKYPDITNKILENGHDLGNHSYSHRELKSVNKESLVYEMEQANKALKECGNYKTSLFRPPKGEISLSMLRYCMNQKVKIIMWSVDSVDFRAEDSKTIIENVDPDKIKGGDIILFHDKNRYTLEALPFLIDKIHNKGLEFSTITGIL